MKTKYGATRNTSNIVTKINKIEIETYNTFIVFFSNEFKSKKCVENLLACVTW